MSDILIRDVPEEVVAAIDRLAKRMGLSHTEYIRRKLAQDAQTDHSPVTIEDLSRFGDAVRDLADDVVIRKAWM